MKGPLREAVGELLRRRIGLDPAASGPGLVARAVRARLAAHRLGEADAATYLGLLNDSEEEVQALVEEAVVPESWFLRDGYPFALLADRAEGLAPGPGRTLRVLSVPCARGEEPYSIALALLDRGWTADRFRVDAVDVSRVMVEAARRGVYTANAFRSKDLGFRDRHFHETAAGFEVGPAVRSAVTFHRGNLVDPTLLSGRPAYDVVFCRNLLIYLDDDARQQAAANLNRLLGPAGLLFLGHAEQLGPLGPHFRPTGPSRCFAFERSGPSPASGPAATGPRRAAVPARREPARPPAVTPPRRAAPPALRPPPAPAAEPPPRPLDEAARLADLGRHAEAAALCEQEIRRAGPSPAVYFLLGVIRQAEGAHDPAERCFEKAVYLDPAHAEALLALAMLAQRRGNAEAAANYRRRATRASRETPPQ